MSVKDTKKKGGRMVMGERKALHKSTGGGGLVEGKRQ